MKTILLAAALLSSGPLTAQGQTSRSAAQPVAAAPTDPTAADQALFTKLVGEVAAAIAKHDMDALGKLMAPTTCTTTPTTTRPATRPMSWHLWPPGARPP